MPGWLGNGRRALSALGVGLALLGIGCTPRSEPENTPAKPDIVLIVIDTLRADHLSHYGYPRRTDAGLDGFRNEATRFEHAYTPAPWTGPSVASLMTGLFTARHRINAHGAKLPEELLTLAELLRAAQWQTAGYSFNVEVSSHTGYAQGFEQWEGFRGQAGAYPDIRKMWPRIKQWLAHRDPKRPFFLYLQPMNVHGPYKVPEARQTRLLGTAPSRSFRYLGPEMKATLHGKSIGPFDPALRTSLIDQYDTAIRYTTDEIGRFLAWLRSQKLYENSLIILTADHGEELLDHGGFSHGYTLYDEVLHIPLYVKSPGQHEPQTVSRSVSLTDLYPTLVEWLGLEPRYRLDGQSFLPELREPTRKNRAPPGPRLHQAGWEKRCKGRAIVAGGYKLIDLVRDYRSSHPRILLFNLESDPREQHDLAQKEPARAARLRRRLDTRFARFEHLALEEPENVLDQIDPEKLKALGYLE